MPSNGGYSYHPVLLLLLLQQLTEIFILFLRRRTTNSFYIDCSNKRIKHRHTAGVSDNIKSFIITNKQTNKQTNK